MQEVVLLKVGCCKYAIVYDSWFVKFEDIEELLEDFTDIEEIYDKISDNTHIEIYEIGYTFER